MDRPERSSQGRPLLSLIVIAFNIPREIARTLVSLSASYQRDIDPEDYEIIVVDNGSNPALGEDIFADVSGNFRLVTMDPPHPSPAQAINRGLREARGDLIGVLFDGARLVTPGLLHFALHGAGLYDKPVVATLGWYLGTDFQVHSARAGYNQAVEDELLASIAWPSDGYRLFEIATPDETSMSMGLGGAVESNALFLRRDMWSAFGGADERFDMPGGGFLVVHMYRLALEQPGARRVLLLGEGTFHQYHGGIATNASVEEHPERMAKWRQQHFELGGKKPGLVVETTFIGKMPKPVLWRMTRVATGQYPKENPLGRDFDLSIWSDGPPVRPADPAIASLVDISHAEFRARNFAASAAVARLARQRAPEEPEPARMAALAGPWLDDRVEEGRVEAMSPSRQADVHLALGKAYAALGEPDSAEREFLAAIAKKPNFAEAHSNLSLLRMPGPIYLTWIAWFHKQLKPRSLVEIGVDKGYSLAQAQPPTIAIGVDPSPVPSVPFQTQTHLFVETSDAFFEAGRLDGLLGGQPIGMAFIDGLHLFEQALKDFINLEAHCDKRSVILLHDTVPTDEPSQARERNTEFHTGDIWRLVLCLKELRPDLDVFTITTAPSGLTVVTNLDPQSRRLSDDFDAAVARFLKVSYCDIAGKTRSALNMVPNSWPAVRKRLGASGILA